MSENSQDNRSSPSNTSVATTSSETTSTNENNVSKITKETETGVNSKCRFLAKWTGSATKATNKI